MIDIVKSIDRFFNVDIFLVGYKIFYELVMVILFLIFYEDFVERKRLSEILLYKNRLYIIKFDFFREGRYIVFLKNIYV